MFFIGFTGLILTLFKLSNSCQLFLFQMWPRRFFEGWGPDNSLGFPTVSWMPRWPECPVHRSTNSTGDVTSSRAATLFPFFSEEKLQADEKKLSCEAGKVSSLLKTTLCNFLAENLTQTCGKKTARRKIWSLRRSKEKILTWFDAIFTWIDFCEGMVDHVDWSPNHR